MSRMQRLPSNPQMRQVPGPAPASSRFPGPSSTPSSSLYPPGARPRPTGGNVTAAFMAPLKRLSRNLQELTDKKSMRYSNDSAYTSSQSLLLATTPRASEKFSLSPDPTQWGSDLSPNLVEDDDYLHTPEKTGTGKSRQDFVLSSRGIVNMGCLTLLVVGIVGLFAGYPIASHFASKPLSTLGGFNLGGINATGQVPQLIGNIGLIDKDTPQEALTKPSWNNGPDMELVFSDEFNVDGRTFYPGDDPYWEAADMYYWSTNDLEWYDPAAITTQGGSLVITMSEQDPINNHNMSYRSGMISSWNKFCFTGGYIEVNVSLPGQNDVSGFWPAIWTLGNLGRAGYGASLEGLWPYTYDSCDVGTLPNQTLNGEPFLATIDGDPSVDGVLSYLPGQRMSRCTCPGESHPGPVHSDGTYVGRSAPEIDIFEAQVGGTPQVGGVSQSGQWAPFNYAYEWFNTSKNMVIRDPDISQMNSYMGSALQQATSVVTTVDQGCYTAEQGCYGVYGFEYTPGYDGYVTWVASNQVSWTLNAPGLDEDPRVNISARPIPQEPMYIIMNFGMSPGFAFIDQKHLIFPATMAIDYVRVYQPKDSKNIGCDPPDFPTAAYINTYIDAYTNPNLTVWGDGPSGYNQSWPANSMLGQCASST